VVHPTEAAALDSATLDEDGSADGDGVALSARQHGRPIIPQSPTHEASGLTFVTVPAEIIAIQVNNRPRRG
jgi:hypothetical protein